MDEPLRADDHVRGPQDGELIVIYADFTCPYCALAHARLSELEVRRPLRRVFRHLALTAKHPRAVALGCAAEAAARQGAFWEFHDAVYADPGRIDDPHLWAIADRLGLDVERFDRDCRDDEALARVKRDTREAVLAGATSTPTFFVDGAPNPALYHDLVRKREMQQRSDPLPKADQKGNPI